MSEEDKKINDVFSKLENLPLDEKVRLGHSTLSKVVNVAGVQYKGLVINLHDKQISAPKLLDKIIETIGFILNRDKVDWKE